MVNLIRNERLNAKIDAQAGVVIMVNTAPSVYEQIVDRTKGLSFQTLQMANTLLTAAPPAAAS